jgi:hypothetical protein
MKKMIMGVAAVLVAAGGSAIAFTDEGNRRFSEFLNGLNEAPAIVSTTGDGTFRAVINREETEIRYTLTFKELEGDVRQAHIHIGHPQNSGGIVLWLCDSEANPSPTLNTPACNQNDPADLRAGTASGILTEADVQSLAANGVAGPTTTTPGEFAEVIALLRAGKTYVNVHTVKFGSGEIRSQIENHEHRGHGDDHRR